MPQFEKQVNLAAVRLSRADLVALGRLLCDGLQTERGDAKFTLYVGDAEHQGSSIDELLSQDLPKKYLDELSFTASCPAAGGDFDPWIKIDLSHSISSVTVRSTGEIWANAKIQQIQGFFAAKRPWYGKFVGPIWGLIGLTGGLTIGIWLDALGSHDAVLSYAPFAIIVVFLALFIAAFKGYLFPLAKVHLSENGSPRASRETILVAIVALGIVAGVVLQLFDIAR